MFSYIFTALQIEEEQHKNQLQALKDQQVVAEGELAHQVKKRDELEAQEQKYWKEYSKYKREVNVYVGWRVG